MLSITSQVRNRSCSVLNHIHYTNPSPSTSSSSSELMSRITLSPTSPTEVVSISPSSSSPLTPISSSRRSNSTPSPLKSLLPSQLQQQSDDIVIVTAVRTAIGKAKRGIFKDTPVEELLTAVLTAILSRSNVLPSSIGDIVVGSVLGANLQRANEIRIASLLSNMGVSVPVRLINRQCSSGLQAIADVAAAIRMGYYEIGIAAGVESMSTDPLTQYATPISTTSSSFSSPQARTPAISLSPSQSDLSSPSTPLPSSSLIDKTLLNPHILTNPSASACLTPIGLTSEIVAQRYSISRESMDAASLLSHQRAAKAQKAGLFKQEIVPLTVNWRDPKTGILTNRIATEDEGIRPDTTLTSLSLLPPVFKPDGTTTAGNSSQVSDGAAAVLLTTRAYAIQHSLPILATFRSFACVGVDPEVMGVGPVAAIPKAVSMAGIDLSTINLWELNEAFASQYVYCTQALSLDTNRVNVNGGSIALGHPLGCTGARLVVSLLYELNRRKEKYGGVSMCVGSGMGAAAVFEAEMNG